MQELGQKKLANFFMIGKSCFCLLRKILVADEGETCGSLGNRIRWECVEAGWSCGSSGGVVWDQGGSGGTSVCVLVVLFHFSFSFSFLLFDVLVSSFQQLISLNFNILIYTLTSFFVTELI